MKGLKPLLSTNNGRGKWYFLKKHKWILGILLFIFLIVIYWDKSSGSSVSNFVLGKKSSLKEESGKVNVLLLGIAGAGHDGPNLTDTILVVSYDLQTRQVTLISLPRDLWLDEHKAKVNTLYQIGLSKGNGLEFVSKEIGDIIGLSIPYVIRADFNGFVKAVDLVEGVDVEVEHPFDDYAYPLEGHANDLCGNTELEMDVSADQAKDLGVEPGKLKVLLNQEGKIATAAARPQTDLVYTDNTVLKYFPCRFDRLSFKQGLTHMNGGTALKFVRSRHGTNNEGTDFARSRRQQLVLQAFKNQVLSLNTLTDPQKIINLMVTFGSSIETNFSQSQYLDFIKLAKEIKSIHSFVIDESGDKPLLVIPPITDYGAWVLIPPGNNFSAIHQYVRTLLENEASGSANK